MSHAPDHLVEIYAEVTPNPNTLKFILNRQFLESGSIDFPTAEKAKGSFLPETLFKIESVKGVLIGKDFITVSKDPQAEWEMLVNFVIEAIKTCVASGQPFFAEGLQTESVSKDADEIEQRIRQILDEEIRPAVARDGGDIIFYGFQDGVVTLHLQGACSTCPSSIFTLKMGVETRLKAAIPEVKEVVQV